MTLGMVLQMYRIQPWLICKKCEVTRLGCLDQQPRLLVYFERKTFGKISFKRHQRIPTSTALKAAGGEGAAHRTSISGTSKMSEDNLCDTKFKQKHIRYIWLYDSYSLCCFMCVDLISKVRICANSKRTKNELWEFPWLCSWRILYLGVKVGFVVGNRHV